MKIKITSEEELVEIAEEAIQVIFNLRKFTKLWEETHGVELKVRKKHWEAIADKLIERLELSGLKKKEIVKFEKK